MFMPSDSPHKMYSPHESPKKKPRLATKLHVEAELKKECNEEIKLLKLQLELQLRKVGRFRNGVASYQVGAVPGVVQVVVWKDELEMGSIVDVNSEDMEIYLYKLNEEDASAEAIGGGGGGEEEDDQSDAVGSHHWTIPHKEFSQLWEQLIFDSTVKVDLLGYIRKTLFLSRRGLAKYSNRLILLHGPPGTGKTSLCKALAHKISIRLAHLYSAGSELVEINAHSLFSKWFSESGKLVQKMFRAIEDLAKNQDSLVIVMIDEVESLVSARSNMGSEPSDAMRVVNAVLTQLDRLRGYSNLLILATSNLFSSLDDAFVSRADMKFHLDVPTYPVIYAILSHQIQDFIDEGVVSSADVGFDPVARVVSPDSQKLMEIAKSCVGLSGRSLQKLPMSAYPSEAESVTLPDFLEAIAAAVKVEVASFQAKPASG